MQCLHVMHECLTTKINLAAFVDFLKISSNKFNLFAEDTLQIIVSWTTESSPKGSAYTFSCFCYLYKGEQLS